MIIKFNLVPVSEKIEEEKKLGFRSIGYLGFLFLLLAVVTVIIIGSGLWLTHKERKYQRIKKMKLAELEKYKKIARKVKLLEKQNEEIKQKIKTIVSLKKKQGRFLKVYDVLVSSIGNNKILFKNLSIREGVVSLQALALDLEEVANYLKALEIQKKIFKSIDLKNTHRKKIKELTLVEFNTEIRF